MRLRPLGSEAMPGPLEVDDDVIGVGGAVGALQTESTYHVLRHTRSSASVTFVYRNTRKHTALFRQADVKEEEAIMWNEDILSVFSKPTISHLSLSPNYVLLNKGILLHSVILDHLHLYCFALFITASDNPSKLEPLFHSHWILRSRGEAKMSRNPLESVILVSFRWLWRLSKSDFSIYPKKHNF